MLLNVLEYAKIRDMVDRRNEEQLARTKYFDKFAKQHLSSMRILRGGHLLYPQQGISNRLIFRKTDQEIQEQEGVEVWRNVAEHSVVQAANCMILGELIGLEQERIGLLGRAALIHDHDKQYQSMGLQGINKMIDYGLISGEEGGRLKYDFFEESEQHSCERLRMLGVEEQVIDIASADGHPALPRMMDPSVTIEEQIMHYIGSCMHESEIRPLDERIDVLERNERCRMMNEYGRQVFWTDGKTLYAVQRELGHKIERELAMQVVNADTVPGNLNVLLQAHPENLPRIIKIYWNIKALANIHPDYAFNKTEVWKFSLENPLGETNVGPDRGMVMYDRPELYFYTDPPVDPITVSRREEVLVVGTNVEVDTLEKMAEKFDFGAKGIAYASRVGTFWEKFFGVDNFLDDVDKRSAPEEIVATGNIRNYNWAGGQTVNISTRLDEIARKYEVPIRFITPFAP